jgi:serine/threonine protein phosphatase 1
MGRLFGIPDIHGRLDLLNKLLTKLETEHQLDLTVDKLIFLGDMIDRGPDSKGVLERVRELHQKHPETVVVLRANHEDMMVVALLRGHWPTMQMWMNNGGGKTLWSFGDLSQGIAPQTNPVPRDILEWLRDLPLFHREHGFFFSHAPAPKEKDREKSDQGKPFTAYELMWNYMDDERGQSRNHGTESDGTPIVGVCGHIHRLSSNLFCPRHYEHYLFLDAGCGCYHKAPLVATEVRSREVFAVWPDGQEPILNPPRPHIPKVLRMPTRNDQIE